MAVPLLRSVRHLLVDARVVVAVPLNTRQFNQHRYSSQHRNHVFHIHHEGEIRRFGGRRLGIHRLGTHLVLLERQQ